MAWCAEGTDPCCVCLGDRRGAVPADGGCPDVCQAGAAGKRGEAKEEDQRRTERPRERSSSIQPSKKAQLSRWLSLPALLDGSEGQLVCGKHQEPLKVFCKEDRALLCLVCDKSRQHTSHTVLPLEEAAEDYKEEIRGRLQTLKAERQAAQNCKETLQTCTSKYLEEIKMERQKLLQEFRKLHLFLEKQEGLLLAQLAELEKEVEEAQKQNNTSLSCTFSCLGDLIRDLEEGYRQPAVAFLQGIKKSLSRCDKKKCSWPLERFPNPEKLSAISRKNTALMEKIQKFKETLAIELKRERMPWLNAVWGEKADQPQILWPVMCRDLQRTGTRVNVTLDPHTANPKLIISHSRKTVTHGRRPQALPDNPERFDSEPFVLGCEGFCSGKHCWVVSVEEGKNWAVGVARASVKRKGHFSLSPEQGIWAVEQCWGEFQALTSHWTRLSLCRKPRRIRVSLDYERGQVAFFDADLDVLVFAFPPGSFKQEKIYPWLWVGPESHLRL